MTYKTITPAAAMRLSALIMEDSKSDLESHDTLPLYTLAGNLAAVAETAAQAGMNVTLSIDATNAQVDAFKPKAELKLVK